MTNHTFVVCAYGDSPYLSACIDSLQAQNLKSNIILYTSTPSNYISEICQDKRIDIYTGDGGSIGRDWNNALSFVNTKYATIAHQDDYYEIDYLEKIMSKISDRTLIAYSDYYEYKNNKEIRDNTNLKIKRLMLNTLNIFKGNNLWRKRVLAFGNPICCPAVTYNLDKLSNFQFDESMHVSIDWHAWYQISKLKGDFTFIKEQLMFHRIHEESETTNMIQDDIRTEEDLVMFKLFWPDFIARILIKYYIKGQDSNEI